MVILWICAQIGQIMRHLTNIFRNRHFIVIQNENQVIQPRNIVHALINHTAGKGTITDECEYLAGLIHDFFGTRDANGDRQRCAAMTGYKRIVWAFFWIGKAGDSSQLPQCAKLIHTAGKQFMGIALMAYIEYNAIIRAHRTINSDRKFHCTQIRSQMPAGFGNIPNQEITNFGAQRLQCIHRKLFYILRAFYRF